MSHIVIDFDKIDPNLLSLLPKRENGYGGFSYGIRYNGKKLYVRYDKRKCRGGLVKWNGGGLTFGISLPDNDPYLWRANDIDYDFYQVFGSHWCELASGDMFKSFYFSVKLDETVFFGMTYDGVEGAIPVKSDIRVLALWDKVSFSSAYGAVIRPKAIQVNVICLDQTHYDEEGPLGFESEEVRRFNSPILVGALR